MRLLQRDEGDTFSFTKDFLGDDKIPPYAILSHTWGEEELLFADLNDGTYKSKKGYDKIRFCGEQAQRDGLQYFWVDTCCINKPDTVELQDAINSMFSWYQKAARCYVYLTDVAVLSDTTDTDVATSGPSWSLAFQKSRWFTRGWTLQELLAPPSVEFFSGEGTLLGDKKGLAKQISSITHIPTQALQGTSLHEFTTDQKLSWIRNRQTTRKEDKAYSLLGIFGIFMSLIYGEGEENAFERLRRKIAKKHQESPSGWSKEQQEAIRKLRVTDPRHDKRRIQETKGGLLADSYRWVLENTDFKRWRTGDDDRLLWIKGDPGKGKTMLLCGIIDEIKESSKNTTLLSYFFCQSTDSRINNATAILRGLLYMIISEKPALISHIQSISNDSGGTAFEDINAWVALSGIMTKVLKDPALDRSIIVIDALDECTEGLSKLLDFIVQISTGPYPVKLVVSSRNLPHIESHLARTQNKDTLSLEMNATMVSHAVGLYITHKVDQLAQQSSYDQKTRDAVQNHLISNAQDTFLWVALTCQSLERVSKPNVMRKLITFPPGLNALYARMIEQINNSDDAILSKDILACVTTVYRPIKLAELTVLVQNLHGLIGDYGSVREVVNSCGSFLTLRNDTIYFVHQSAKDFLSADGLLEIMPQGKDVQHRTLLSSSLRALLSDVLHRDMNGLKNFGYRIDEFYDSIDDVEYPIPDSSPLKSLAYPCLHWVDHLCESDSEITINVAEIKNDLLKFLSTKYLYWLEALSLLRSIPEGVVSMSKLASFFQVFQQTLSYVIQITNPISREMPIQHYATLPMTRIASSCTTMYQYHCIHSKLMLLHSHSVLPKV